MNVPDREQVLGITSRHLMPHRLETFRRFGVEIVMGERQGYRFRNQGSDEWIYDLHLNGGTYNLGHRNPELCQALSEGLGRYDVGNHHFPSEQRAMLAQELLATQEFGAQFVVFTASGSEAADVAIKAARRATGRRKIVAIDLGYHGRTGLSGAAGDDATARFFLSDSPNEFTKVGWNNAAAIELALADDDVAAVIVETIPATYGFPAPLSGYLEAVRAACNKHGTMLIADEVQTGLGRTGTWWGIEKFGVAPDILITSKGLGGGLYPIGAVLLSEDCGAWLKENGWAHVSTFGGSELGCCVTRKVLEITGRPETWQAVERVTRSMADGLAAIQKNNDYLTEIRQTGLIIGLKFDHPEGALHVMKALLDRGVWAIFAGFDLSVLQFKPGLLMSGSECGDILDRADAAFKAARDMRSSAVMGAAGSVAKIVKLEHAWRRLDGRNDDGFQVAPFPG